jgi:hypothetical protein
MKDQIDGDDPAFPTETATHYYHGMTLRDWFAGQALQGILAHGAVNYRINGVPIAEDITEHIGCACFGIADAMLAARKESK